MPRPQMKLGEWGSIALTGWVHDSSGKLARTPVGARKADKWRARARIRDHDGVVRPVERWGTTKAGAERLLLEHLRERTTPAPADALVKPTSKVRDAAEVWRAEMQRNDRLRVNTRTVYTSSLNRHVIGGTLANLAVREVKVVGIERWLRGIGEVSGVEAMSTARSVLRGVLQLAVKHEAIPHNPMGDVGHVSVPAKASKRDRSRAFTQAEREALLAYSDADSVARRRDLPDLLAFMAGTGARIGEACGLRWSYLDLSTGTAKLGPLPVRVPGVGLVLQEEGKTGGSTRTVSLPPWLVDRLLDRQVNAVGNERDVVFPSAMGRLRDTSNTTKHVRALLDAAGAEWAVGHTFRKTAATWMDESGATIRETANQLGHKRASMTMDVYMSPQTVSERAAQVL